MKKSLQNITVSTITSFALLLGLVSPAFAVGEKGTGQALEIAPPVINLSSDPGKTINTKVMIRDVASTKVLVTNEINDFEASGDDGTPKLLLKEGETSPYSLKSWIKPLPQITLSPKEIVNLPLQINVPASASPGSYFAVVRFSGNAPQAQGTAVSLSASIGALVFLRVNGDAKEQLTIADYYASQDNKKKSLFESTPIQFVARLKNDGNVHEQPVGQVVVSDTFGNNVANVSMNLEKSIVLPGSTRKYTADLDKTVIGDRILFGRYTAKLHVVYGDNQSLDKTISFWVVPYKLIFLAIVLLVAAIVGIRLWMLRYKKRIINQARRRR